MKSLVNISIDDITPHPKSSLAVVERCLEVIKIYPDIKFSLFVPISYWRTIRPETVTKSPLQINLFPDFCNSLKNLPKKNFEICYHGYYHGIPGKSDNDEFQYFNYEEANERFKAMFEVVSLAGLEKVFKKIFRPPAWRMSPDAIKSARDSGIKLLALSPKEYAKNTYMGEEDKVNDVVYYNCNPPFDNLNLYKKTEIVYHACEWDKNYLSVEKTESLNHFLNSNKDNISFSFLEGMLE